MSNKDQDIKKNIINKKNLVIMVAAVMIIAIIIVAAIIGTNDSNKGKEAVTDANGIVVTTVSPDNQKQDAANKKSDEKSTDENSQNESESNYWENVSVYEEGGMGEKATDENGETVTESYPGEADGWSPMVSPDDLKQ